MDQTALYREYHKPIYYSCLRILRSPEDAEECMQDAFIKLFTGGKMRFINNNACFSWLRKVAVRGAIDRLRSLDFQMNVKADLLDSREVRTITTEDDPSFESFFEGEEDHPGRVKAIREQLNALPSGYRTILSLYLFEGYDFDEIAQITQLQPSTVRSQYSRGRRKLQEEIEKLWIN